jgi:hypothetical protein
MYEMRRLTLLALAGVLGLYACSDQNPESPTEPSAAPPSENFGSTCTHGRYPLASVTALAANDALWKNKPARVEALLRLGTIALLWDTCNDQLARKAALSLLVWIDKNTARNADQTKVAELKVAILAGFGESTTPADDDYAADVYVPGTTKVITTPTGRGTIELRPGAFTEPTLITVRRLADNFSLEGLPSGYVQDGPVWDYDATNSSTDNTVATHTLATPGTVTIAFCIKNDFFGEIPEPGVRIGHKPVGAPFEFVDEIDVGDLLAELDACNTPPIFEFGSVDGLWGSRGYLAAVARKLLLPELLHAAAVGTRGPIAGTPISLSPFGIVRPTANELNLLTDPNNHTDDRNHFVGGHIRPCVNPPDAPGDGCQDVLVQMTNASGAPVGAGQIVTASLITINAPEGPAPVLGGGPTQPIGTSEGGGATFASFTDLEIDQPGQYQLRFEAPGAAAVTSETFDVYQLVFTVQPTAAPAPEGVVDEGAFLGQAVPGFTNPVVQVATLDYQGNVVTAASDPIIMFLPSNEFLTMNGDNVINSTNGLANFTEISEVQTGLTADILEGCAGGAPLQRGSLLAFAGPAGGVSDQIPSHNFDVAPVGCD